MGDDEKNTNEITIMEDGVKVTSSKLSLDKIELVVDRLIKKHKNFIKEKRVTSFRKRGGMCD